MMRVTAHEIERKYVLPASPDLERPPLANATRMAIEQTYLAGLDDASERVRLTRDGSGAERYFHTVKRRISALTREETEREIDRDEYLDLWRRRDPERGTIRKTRYRFPYDDRLFELDVFDDPAGLVLLEVELPSEDAHVELPPFDGLREVTGDDAYSNAQLARKARRR
jgi:CYTH domain-containing protein